MRNVSVELEHQWVTAAGLPAIAAIISFNQQKSHRCGYVGIPIADSTALGGLSVHGGVTYNSHTHPITNITTSYMAWVGFDCWHLTDQQIDPALPLRSSRGIVRRLPFVMAECEILARQMIHSIIPMR